MKLSFDRDLLEAAYLSQGPAVDLRREEIYDIEDLQDRDDAFALHVSAWFRRIGLESHLERAFKEWPLVVRACAECVIKQVRNPADELAELFRHDDGTARVGVGLRAPRLDDGSFVAFLRHELHHIHDMLDPAFDYPGPDAIGAAPENVLLRDRYGLLWDITIDARLARRFPDAPEFPLALKKHRVSLDRTFRFMPEPERDALFAELSGTDSPRHDRLWAVASDPRRVRDAVGARLPGGDCAVCGFTTFHWATDEVVRTAAKAIRSEFPEWSEDSGCCERCAEVYAAVATAAIPATVLLPSPR